MKINKTNLVVFGLSIVLGIVLAIQFKQKVPEMIPVTLKSIEVTKNEINAINKEIDELKIMIRDKEEKIEMYESIIDGNENIADLLKEELNKNKAVAGFETVKGPGIIVKMWDNMDENALGQAFDMDIIHDVDVLRIINDLRDAGAEAISINGQRVLAISEIKCGGPIIRINGKSVGTPIYISAIGDPQVLSAAINAPNTYGYALKNISQINLETSLKDEIIVPAFNGFFEFRYAKPVREGD